MVSQFMIRLHCFCRRYKVFYYISLYRSSSTTLYLPCLYECFEHWCPLDLMFISLRFLMIRHLMEPDLCDSTPRQSVSSTDNLYIPDLLFSMKVINVAYKTISFMTFLTLYWRKAFFFIQTVIHQFMTSPCYHEILSK